jgi:predicted kinase
MEYKQYKNKKEPFIELLCGISNSGKSTYVIEQYPNGFDGLVLSRDNLVLKYGIGATYNECWSSLTKDLHKDIDDKLNLQYQTALNQNNNIIVDMTNLTIDRRNLWLSKLPNSYIRKIRFFTTTLDIIKKRNRLQAKNKFIPENVLEDMARRFQYPKEDEIDELITEKT